MKRLSKTRKLIATLLTAAILCLLPSGYTLKVSAQESVTFAVEYIESMDEWRYQMNTSVFDSSKEHSELYYLRRALKEGDLVVVYNSTSRTKLLDLGTTPLGNLTVKDTKTFTTISCGDVQDCYILTDANCAINANVKNAYIYGNSISNFNNNVDEIQLMTDGNGLNCTVGCSGVVNHLYSESTLGSRVFYDLYDFQKDTFVVRNGILQTKDTQYSESPKVEITAENFDYMRYADDNADVKAILGYNKDALYYHYIISGIQEGRVAHAIRTDFDYVRYADDYPDLKAAFGYDKDALYNHYITSGITEKRVAYDTSRKIFRY